MSVLGPKSKRWSSTSATEDVKLSRLDTLARVFSRADSVLARRGVSVSVRAVTGSAPAWSTASEIVFNASEIPDEFGVNEVMSLKGLNMHEIAHILYTPRNGSTISRWVIENDAWQAFNALEDQRIETLLVGRFPSIVPWLTATVSLHLLDKSEHLSSQFPLIRGRKYLPVDVRAKVRSMYSVQEDIDEICQIVDEYRTLLFPVDTERAQPLIMRFKELLRNIPPQPHGECNFPDPFGHGKRPSEGVDSEGGSRPATTKEQERDRDRSLKSDKADEGPQTPVLPKPEPEDAEPTPPTDSDSDDESSDVDDYSDDVDDYSDDVDDYSDDVDADDESDDDSDDADSDDADDADDSDADDDDSDESDSADDSPQGKQPDKPNKPSDNSDDDADADSDDSDDDGDDSDDDEEADDDGDALGAGDEGTGFDEYVEQVKDTLEGLLDEVFDKVRTEVEDLIRQANGEEALATTDEKQPEKLVESQGDLVLKDADSATVAMARAFGQELERLRADSDPGWDKGVSSGRLNPLALVRGDDWDSIYDRWSEGLTDSTDIECVIALDNSGSMEGENADFAYRSMWAIKRSLDAVEARTTVLTFNSVCNTLYDATERATNRIKDAGAGGGTSPHRALNYAQRVFSESDRAIKLLFVITDGDWGGSQSDIDPDEVIKKLRNANVLTALAQIGGYTLKGHNCEVTYKIGSAESLAKLGREVVRLGIQRQVSNY